MIQNCSSQRLRRRALRDAMNLQQLLDCGRAYELSNEQAKGIEENTNSGQRVNQLKDNTPHNTKAFKRGKETTKPKDQHDSVNLAKGQEPCYFCNGICNGIAGSVQRKEKLAIRAAS